MIKVVVIGAGTAIPAKGRSPASIYMHTGKEHILFDAGPGTLQRLHTIGVSLFDIDRIFLSHFHLDHCLDIATLLFARRIPTCAQQKPLAIYGPRGLKTLHRRFNHALNGWMTPRGFRLTLRELKQERVQLPGYSIQTKFMNHYDTGALGYRLTSGKKTIAYSGDTDVCKAITVLGHNADVLILECAMTDECKVEGHLTPTLCGELAAAANAKRLALTHFYPIFDGYDIRARVRRHYRGPLTIAHDFTRLQI